MNFRIVHQNLDTSFVNLSALIKYLRRRQFAGIVRVKLNNYEAEIHITDENQMNVREQDHLSGRVSEGEEALQRILIRAREPGGVVNVFQRVSENISAEISLNKNTGKIAEISEKPSASVEKQTDEPNSPSPQRVKAVAEIKRKSVPAKFSGAAEIGNEKINMPPTERAVKQGLQPSVSLPDFPFRLSNNVETKAQKTRFSSEQFQMLVKILAEILGTIDRSLASAQLNFPAAFARACAEISGDYPFLKPDENIFNYSKGEIKINGQINPNQLTASQIEAVRRVLEKLQANPKFSHVYRASVQNLLALIRQRKPLYDEFSITPKLEKILGAR